MLKDLTDVAQLISVNRVDPQSPWLRAVFEKHGNQEIYERVRKLLQFIRNHICGRKKGYTVR